MDSYESKNRYYLLARLSQITYYETIERQRQNAVNTALGLLDKAESEFAAQTFTFLNEAMQELAPYMDLPIEVEYPQNSSKKVNLYSYLKLALTTYINRVQVTPRKDEINIKLGFTRGVKLEVQIVDNNSGTPIESIPVTLRLSDAEKSAVVLSASDGKYIFSLPELQSKQAIQHLDFQVDMNQLLGDNSLFGNLPKVQAQSILKVVPPDIYIQITETNLGDPSVNPYVMPVISEFFANQYSANIIDSNEADLIIYGSVNSRKVGETPNEWGMYQTFADATITIVNGLTGDEIVSKSFNKIQGSDFNSNQEAANQALKKLSERITEEFLPELIDLIHGF